MDDSLKYSVMRQFATFLPGSVLRIVVSYNYRKEKAHTAIHNPIHGADAGSSPVGIERCCGETGLTRRKMCFVYGPAAQLAEHLTVSQEDVGSNPIRVVTALPV